MSSAAEAMSRGKMALLLKAPFYAAIMMHLNFKPDNTIPTAGTDGVVLRYNEGFIESLTPGQLRGLLAHEVLHVALEHIFRGENKEHERWNIACDYAVNLILVNDNYVIPRNGYIDKKYTGMTAEQIYRLLEPEASPKSIPCKWHVDGQPDNEEGGSGEYSPSMVGEVNQYDPSKADKESPAPMSVSEAQAEWRVRVAQAMETARMQGAIPGGLERMVTECLKPVIPWQSALSRFMVENTKNDYTWTQPSKRYLHAGQYLPTMESPSLGKIVIAVDTSGSVTKENINEYAAEMRAILAIAPGTEIEVVYADSAVAHTEKVSIYDLDLHPKGGGGTDYAPTYEYVNKQGEPITCLIYFTDGECWSFPKASPEYPTLWVISGMREFNPPFGEVIYTER
jgi:predicted metal-dependent peptidase